MARRERGPLPLFAASPWPWALPNLSSSCCRPAPRMSRQERIIPQLGKASTRPQRHQGSSKPIRRAPRSSPPEGGEDRDGGGRPLGRTATYLDAHIPTAT